MILVMFGGGLFARKDDLRKQILSLYSQKEYQKVLTLLSEQKTLDDRLNRIKYNTLMALKQYPDALAFIETLMKSQGNKQHLLAAKVNILLARKQYNTALETNRIKDDLAKTKSPWDAIRMAQINLLIKQNEDAMGWLEEAFKRGFIHYRLLAQKQYEPLEENPKFFQLIESIKFFIGLGKPAKTFSANLITGETFSLSKLRGKVVLVSFWAYWCKPCKQESTLIRSYYEEFRGKGFEVIAISLDTNKELFQKYLQEEKFPWKWIYSGKGWEDEIVKKYGVISLPSHWVIDRNGYLRSMDVKGTDLRKAIQQILTGVKESNEKSK